MELFAVAGIMPLSDFAFISPKINEIGSGKM
jgi:hypothetical protein